MARDALPRLYSFSFFLDKSHEALPRLVCLKAPGRFGFERVPFGGFFRRDDVGED